MQSAKEANGYRRAAAARLMKFDNPVGPSLLSIAQIDSAIFDGQRAFHLEG